MVLGPETSKPGSRGQARSSAPAVKVPLRAFASFGIFLAGSLVDPMSLHVNTTGYMLSQLSQQEGNTEKCRKCCRIMFDTSADFQTSALLHSDSPARLCLVHPKEGDKSHIVLPDKRLVRRSVQMAGRVRHQCVRMPNKLDWVALRSTRSTTSPAGSASRPASDSYP